MNNEVTIEEYDKNLRQTTKMASDNEQKLDELTRKLGVQEDELRRALERAELAENKLKSIEEELQIVGENMKQLEKSAEKAVEREEKLKDKILQIQQKYKVAEGRFEYGEITSPSSTRGSTTSRTRSTGRSSRSRSVLMTLATPSMTCLLITKHSLLSLHTVRRLAATCR